MIADKQVAGPITRDSENACNSNARTRAVMPASSIAAIDQRRNGPVGCDLSDPTDISHVNIVVPIDRDALK